MKKLIVSLLAAIAVLATPAIASAATVQPTTDVTGTVTAGGHVLANASVNVTCRSTTANDTTDSDGDYLVVFSASACPKGSSVTVTADKSGQAGSNTGTAGAVTTKLNVAVVNVAVSLPEMGTLTATLAAAGAGAAFFVIRRRQVGQF